MKYSRLGDTFYEDKAVKINQALEKINAPYYQVCKKVRGSRASKDAFDISWRKRNITCDDRYPNATTTGEKVVMKQLEKNFGISLSLLNSDTPRAIKKSLDFQKAQQTILDNKIKAREERERNILARKEAREMAKNNKSSKTTKTTTETKSIPSPERNDNKTVANRQNEILTEKIDNITYFYAIVKNGRRKNYAKLNTLTNRVQYLSSAVPIYVKEFIKDFRSGNVKAAGKTTKEDKKVDERINSHRIEIEKLIKFIANRVDGDLLIEQHTFSSARVYKNNEFLGGLQFQTVKIDQDLFIIEAYKKGINSPFMKIEGDFATYTISSKFATAIKKLSAEYENSKTKSSPAKSTKATESKETTPKAKETKAEEKSVVNKADSRKNKIFKDVVNYIKEIAKEDDLIIKMYAKEDGYDKEDDYTPLEVHYNNQFLGVIKLYEEENSKDQFILLSAYFRTSPIRIDSTPFNSSRINYNEDWLTPLVKNKITEILEFYVKEINNIKSTPKQEEKKEMKPINEPETTEIIKEAPPIMIDEDEAAKFDKGLDELTKLLQQAMQ